MVKPNSRTSKNQKLKQNSTLTPKKSAKASQLASKRITGNPGLKAKSKSAKSVPKNKKMIAKNKSTEKVEKNKLKTKPAIVVKNVKPVSKLATKSKMSAANKVLPKTPSTKNVKIDKTAKLLSAVKAVKKVAEKVVKEVKEATKASQKKVEKLSKATAVGNEKGQTKQADKKLKAGLVLAEVKGKGKTKDLLEAKGANKNSKNSKNSKDLKDSKDLVKDKKDKMDKDELFEDDEMLSDDLDIDLELDEDLIEEVKDVIIEEVISLSEDFRINDIFEAIKDMSFFTTHENDDCVEKACENVATTQGFCRYHYIKNWKSIKKKLLILQEGKLQELISELVTKFSPKQIETIMNDLADDKGFFKILKELNIETDFDEESFNEDDDDFADDTKPYVADRPAMDEEV
jgi:hypothetical protein